MMNIDECRAWLIASLRASSLEVSDSFSDRLPTARELDSIILLGDLASDVANVSEHVLLLFQKMLLVDDLARNFERVGCAMFRRVGTAFTPRDATELVRSLMLETLHGERRQRPAGRLGTFHLPAARPPRRSRNGAYRLPG